MLTLIVKEGLLNETIGELAHTDSQPPDAGMASYESFCEQLTCRLPDDLRDIGRPPQRFGASDRTEVCKANFNLYGAAPLVLPTQSLSELLGQFQQPSPYVRTSEMSVANVVS